LWDDRRLADGIEAAAAATPDRTALVDGRESLTWAALGGQVEQATGWLAGQGAGPGMAVVVVCGNSVDGAVAYHALLRLGALAVLLDRRCGRADLSAAVAATGPDLVLLPDHDPAGLGAATGAAAVARLGGWRAADERRSTPVGRPEPDRDGPALVLFTSGTTSRPKAVAHSINTITAGARNMALTTAMDPNSVIYLVSPLTSITGVIQMHLAADGHATLVLDDDFDPERSLDRISQVGATTLGGAPVIIERLIAVADRRQAGRVAFHTLALGGTTLPRAFLERIADRYGIDVVRVYGSSEYPNATGRRGGGPGPDPLADDGALMPGTEVRVGSSRHDQEGLLRGPALMLGYLDRADSDESFEDGWYRTGDLLEVAGDRLTVVGRLKEIVNRNGLKISLAEIDAALSDLPGAVEAAGFGMADPDTGEHLAVAVRSQPGGQVTLDGLLTHLRAAGLATRKLPERLVTWDGPLPRTASGKVVRSALMMDAPSKRAEVVDRLRRP
jgi:acyl-CoA synthetase (AMP-forming)/AMP-acid ligase II